MSIELADILRKLAFGQAFVIVLMTGWIVVRYARKIVRAPREERAMPTHIALVGISHIGMAGFIIYDLFERLGQIPSWRIPTALSIFTFSVAAMVFMVSHLSARRILASAFARKVEAEAAKEVMRIAERSEQRISRMEELGVRTADKLSEMHVDVKEGSHKADLAYNEANDLNEKIETGSTHVNKALQFVREEAELAKITAKEVSDKADTIGEVGTDTNERVRKIEGGGQ